MTAAATGSVGDSMVKGHCAHLALYPGRSRDWPRRFDGSTV
jgi:hypothetical protein